MSIKPTFRKYNHGNNGRHDEWSLNQTPTYIFTLANYLKISWVLNGIEVSTVAFLAVDQQQQKLQVSSRVWKETERIRQKLDSDASPRWATRHVLIVSSSCVSRFLMSACLLSNPTRLLFCPWLLPWRPRDVDFFGFLQARSHWIWRSGSKANVLCADYCHTLQVYWMPLSFNAFKGGRTSLVGTGATRSPLRAKKSFHISGNIYGLASPNNYNYPVFIIKGEQQSTMANISLMK